MLKTRIGAGRGFPICFLHLACLFPFEVLSKLLTFLACDSLSFSLACLIFSRTSLAREVRGRPRECFLPRSFGAFLSESSAGAPLPVRAPRASRHERRTWADRPHNQDLKLPLQLILVGHEAHDEATASGGKDRAKPHRAKIVPAHGCAAEKHSTEIAEIARWLNSSSSNTPTWGPTLLSISAPCSHAALLCAGTILARWGLARSSPAEAVASSCASCLVRISRRGNLWS